MPPLPKKTELDPVKGPVKPLPTPEIAEEEGGNDEPGTRSRIFKAIANLFYLFLLASLATATVLSILTIDFLDIYQFRYNVPEEWRTKWPLSAYYDFVQLHQLPEEERYQQLILKEQQRYDRVITQGSQDLERRATELENSYKALMRTQRESYQRQLDELARLREEIATERKSFDEEKAALETRRASLDDVAKRLASETLSVESSLIRFMEEDNRLEQVQRIAQSMSPEPLGSIFDEVRDNKLIYDIIRGLPPQHAAAVLSSMDPEKAGRIMGLGQEPIKLPPPGPARTYIPPGLQSLLDETSDMIR